jgi:hypothetical protein
MIFEEIIEKLGAIRGNYNCFDPEEEPYYRACSEAIHCIRQYYRIFAIVAEYKVIKKKYEGRSDAEVDDNYFFNKILETFTEET